jgi:hypothetical protein
MFDQFMNGFYFTMGAMAAFSLTALILLILGKQ